MNKKLLKMEIIKLLPDNWSATQKYQFFESLADEYRKKSRDEVNSDERKFRAKIGKQKTEDYSPVLKNK